MKRVLNFESITLVFCFVLSLGCQPVAEPTAAPSDPNVVVMDELPPESDDDHASEGPHGGTLIELGKEEYHAELLHDATSVTIHILDAAATQTVAIDAPDVTVNLLHDGKPEQFKLVAAPEEEDADGKSSRFTLVDEHLAGHIDDESSAPKLSVTINGTAYRGDIHHHH